MAKRRRFEDGDKFWEVWIEGTSVKTHNGKLGANGKLMLKELPDAAAAKAQVETWVAEKVKKGFVEQGTAPAKAAKPAKTAKPATKASKGGYRDRLVAMVDALKQDKRFKVEKFKLGKPATPAQIEKARAQAGGTLPAGIAELYAEVGSVSLEWRVVADLELAGEGRGLIELCSIAGKGAMFDDHRDMLYFSDTDSWSKLKPFDFFIAEACTALYPVPGDATIHYHYCGEELHPTGYSVDEFFDRLIMSRGYWYWVQTLAVDTRKNTESTAFLEDAPGLFADFDKSLFKPNTKQHELEHEY